jgi:anti-anti-sigma regulatory factor
MRTQIIDLKKYFDHSIATRVAVQNIFVLIRRNSEEIILDFDQINFISSSASHQFFLEERKLEKENKIVSFINVNNDVEKMLELAKKDRKNLFTIQEIKHQSVTSEEDLSKLLLQT